MPRDWFRRWKTAFWLQRLCGAMPEPSTADAGVDAWTASLAASRASRTPSPESDAALLTLATSGPQPGASSSSPARGSSSSKTSPACSPRQTPTSAPAANGYGETYSAWVSRLRADCSQRRKSARLMSANGSSSSGWPNATAAMTTGAESAGRDGGDNLQTAVKNWPTPAARDIKGANSAVHLEKSSGSLHLDQLPNFVAHCWATPTASENSNRTTKMAPSHGKTHGIVLAGQACDLSEQWATPAVADVQGGRKARSGDRSTELLLNGQAALLAERWPTPTALDRPRSPETLDKCAAFRKANANQDTVPLYLGEVAISHAALSGHLDPTTSMDGATSSPSGRKLNPRFVEMLMGWPPGWTNFACSETALSLWKQLMRSELSRFAYRPAPPPQPDLFG